MPDRILTAAPLTAAEFARFGDVIDSADRRFIPINEGTCRRFDDLANVDVLEDGGRPVISIFEAAPRPLPFPVRVLERHPLSSQAFMPLDARPFLVIVADDRDAPASERIHAFVTSGRQGVNFRRNTWHSALVAIHEASRFLVVDRGGPGENCDTLELGGDSVQVRLPLAALAGSGS